mmetsp:Transcript_3463/g.6572  ORF Transcript_3463/g.6572 Transcript_3463/m.6572 type:complete len:203 (-) Transcript_3463:287-895(-)
MPSGGCGFTAPLYNSDGCGRDSYVVHEAGGFRRMNSEVSFHDFSKLLEKRGVGQRPRPEPSKREKHFNKAYARQQADITNRLRQPTQAFLGRKVPSSSSQKQLRTYQPQPQTQSAAHNRKASGCGVPVVAPTSHYDTLLRRAAAARKSYGPKPRPSRNHPNPAISDPRNGRPPASKIFARAQTDLLGEHEYNFYAPCRSREK